MISYIRRNKKKVMAVIGVLLMIVFIMPPGGDPSGELGRGDVGKIDGQPIPFEEFEQARGEWDVLTNRYPDIVFPRQKFSIPAYMVTRNLPAEQRRQQLSYYMRAREMLSDLTPLNYLLLLREARQMRIQIVPEVLAAELELLKEQLPSLAPDARSARALARPIEHWLMIEQAARRAGSAMKISPAWAEHRLLAPGQSIRLALVEFHSADFRSSVPEPTPEELEAFFQAHRNDIPGSGPSGIGYQIPHRVQLEYIQVPFLRVLDTIGDEDVYLHFVENRGRYMTEPPAPAPPATGPASTQPATVQAAAMQAAATQPATTQAAATTQPRLKEFEELTSEELEQIRKELARERSDLILRLVSRELGPDWINYRSALREAGGKPTTLPATKSGVAYNERSYFGAVAARVQLNKDARKIQLTTVSGGDLLTGKDLETIPGLGTARTNQYWKFPEYVMQAAEAFMTEPQRLEIERLGGEQLALFQPSQPLSDDGDNLYIFRIVRADPAHAPASMRETDADVRGDYLNIRGYEKAKAAAAEFETQARKLGSLAQAANAAGRAVHETKLFSPRERKIDGYDLPDTAVPQFITSSYLLLGRKLSTDEKHPISTIDLPSAFRAVVASLEEARPASYAPEIAQYAMAISRQSTEQLFFEQFMPLWFRPEAIRARVNYAPGEEAARDEPEPRSAPSRRPLF